MSRRPPNAETRLSRVLRHQKPTTGVKPPTVVVAPDTDPAMLREVLKRTEEPSEERKLLIGWSVPLDPIVVPAQDADEPEEAADGDPRRRRRREKREA